MLNKAALTVNHHFSIGLHKVTSTMLNNFVNLVISLNEKTKKQKLFPTSKTENPTQGQQITRAQRTGLMSCHAQRETDSDASSTGASSYEEIQDMTSFTFICCLFCFNTDQQLEATA